jgi:hypothetical protein
LSLLNGIANLIQWILGSVIQLLIFAFVVWCVYDCAMRRFRVPTHKWIWLAVILLGFPPLGALAYVIFGREQGYRYR